MTKLFLFAAAAGLGLISASPPADRDGAGQGSGYPACSRTVTDRCIQLYERGVRSRGNLARNEAMGPERAANFVGRGPANMGMARAGAPMQLGRNEYPQCSASVTDRCIQRGHRRAAPASVAAADETERRVRLGERG
jgi:hypothetical protein